MQGGGWKAIWYSLRVARRVGFRKMIRALRSKNACKTCALGMGGQLGGMVNEGGHFPEVCKKSFQAMASDLQPPVAEEFFANNPLPKLRAMSSRNLEFAGRLTRPMLLAEGTDTYQPVDWSVAVEKVISALESAGPQRSFFYASGRSSNEAGFLLQLMSRLFGTNYVNNCSYYCHQASGVGLGSSIGTGAGTVRLEDLDETDLYFLIGANPASNHPRLLRCLMQIRRRGGKVIVINPAREAGLVKFRVPSDVRSLLFGSEIASRFVQPHIGGDIALLTGIAKEIIAQNAHDETFIANHTEGFDAFRRQIETTSWDEIVSRSGVEEEEIRKIASEYIAAGNVVFGWAMGITHHAHGTDNVRMIANLALLRGMIGRRPAGVMPIRGHSNVQGLGSVGVTPTLKKAVLERFEQRLGIDVPRSPGYDTMACVEAAARGEMDTAICLGGNLYGSNPQSRFAADALAKINTVVYFSTTLNTGHAWGTGRETLILPVLPRDEEPQPTTQESMFSFVRMSEGGSPRYEGPRSEVALLSAIARGLFANDNRIDWSRLESHAAIRELIGELIPGYEAMSKIDETKEEFHVAGRAVSDGRFPTASGRAKFHAVPIPDSETGSAFRLMTVRSEGQFNSVVYEEQDIYRGQKRRDVILMNPADLKRLGIEEDDPVRVTGPAGELQRIRARRFDIREGNVLMYYPEANVLLPRDVDPDSKTPAFKGATVHVTK